MRQISYFLKISSLPTAKMIIPKKYTYFIVLGYSDVCLSKLAKNAKRSLYIYILGKSLSRGDEPLGKRCIFTVDLSIILEF